MCFCYNYYNNKPIPVAVDNINCVLLTNIFETRFIESTQFSTVVDYSMVTKWANIQKRNVEATWSGWF